MPLENELLNQGIERLQSGDYEAALNLLDRVIAENPQQPDAWHQKGLVLQKLGRYVEAVAVNEKFVALTEDLKKDFRSIENLNGFILFDISQQVNLTNQWLFQGIQQSQLGNFEDALESYDQALECKSDCLEAWFNRGFVLRKLHRYEEAIINYDKILQFQQFQPEHFRIWYDRGLALCSLKYHEQGIFSFDEALKIKPDFYQAWYGRGLALQDLGCNEEAIYSYDRALKINPDFYQAWINRGNVLKRIGRYEDAIASQDKAIEINPSFYKSWYNRGEAVLFSLLFSRLSASAIGTSFSQRHPQLNQRGYPGQVITLEFGLTQVISYSEGWCNLQCALGEAHINQGKLKQQLGYDPSLYWQKALHCLDLALSVLSIEAFPELRLEALQLMIRLLLQQGDTSTAQTYRRAGVELLQILLNQTPTAFQRQQIEAEFSGFSQIETDVWLKSGEFVTAIETAERYKNRCLTWILEAWKETVISPGYAAMTALCNPTHAVVYWHLSPDSLTTFLLTHESNYPEFIECDRTAQSQKFIDWMKNWQKDYCDYASKKSTKTERESHPWRIYFNSRLDELRQILQIETITQKIPETIQSLVLIPHCDLHLLPLHLLFPSHLSCTYLPSIQIGLNLLKLPSERKIYVPLLSIEDPKTEQDEMPFAQLESVIVRYLLKDSVCVGPDDASTETVLSRLKKPFATLHFTGHGAYNARNPADSALALTDGLITAKTISQLDLSSYQLVVLAACETALTGNEDIKTEYVGLASAFLKAGAANVLSTLWPVDEISSTWLIVRFYQFLLSGDSPSVALNHAQSWMRTATWEQLTDWLIQLSQLPGLDQGHDILTARANNTRREGTIMGPNQPTKYSHPFYWAGFTLTGRG